MPRSLAASGLKPKAQELLAVLANDPFQNPPPLKNWLETDTALIRAVSIFSIASCTRSLPKKKPFEFCECGRTMNKANVQAQGINNETATAQSSAHHFQRDTPCDAHR